MIVLTKYQETMVILTNPDNITNGLDESSIETSTTRTSGTLER